MRLSGYLSMMALVLLLSSFPDVLTQAMTIDEIISSAEAEGSQNFNSEHQNLVKVELDIVYTLHEWEDMKSTITSGAGRKKRTTGIISGRGGGYRWPNNIALYEFAPGSFTSSDQMQVQAALDDWSKYTCLTFKRAGPGDRNKIRFQNAGGCYSRIGMVGEAQELGLARACRKKGVIIHEVGHALGLQHEQTRPDRDQFVRIIRENIPASLYFNFQKYTWSSIENFGIPYDYGSIMHYGPKAFSSNGGVTIKTIDPKYQNVIGNAEKLTFKDIKTINLMYHCKQATPGCTKLDKDCPGEGFVGKDCKCWCPGSPYTVCNGDSGGVVTESGGEGTTGGTGKEGGQGGGGQEGGGIINETCADKHPNCMNWARIGECRRNPAIMQVNCKKSCNQCTGGPGGERIIGPEPTITRGFCVDQSQMCVLLARRGDCLRNPLFMGQHCRRSCRAC